MKTSTLIKAKRTIAGSLLLIAAFSQTDMALAAFGFGNADEAKVVTVYDEKENKSLRRMLPVSRECSAILMFLSILMTSTGPVQMKSATVLWLLLKERFL